MKYPQLNQIKPERITKPIQLLSTWFIGLVIVNYMLLHYAVLLQDYKNVSAWMIIASILNVPLFIVALFIMQTKFRPEMQEDGYYSEYLKYSNNKLGDSKPIKNREVTENSEKMIEEINNEVDKIVRDIDKSSNLTITEDLNKLEKYLKTLINESFKFAGLKVLLNNRIKDYGMIEEKLRENNILVDEYFGSNSENLPKDLQLIVGRGFSNRQLLKILKIIIEVSDGRISYNSGEEYANQYDNQILIGSYGENMGMKINDAILLLESGIDNSVFYYKINEETHR